MAKVCIPKLTHLSCKVKWFNHLTSKGYSSSLFLGPFGMFCDSNYYYQNNFVCSEFGLINGMTTLHVVGGKVRSMTQESTIVLLAPWIGSYGPIL